MAVPNSLCSSKRDLEPRASKRTQTYLVIAIENLHCNNRVKPFGASPIGELGWTQAMPAENIVLNARNFFEIQAAPTLSKLRMH